MRRTRETRVKLLRSETDYDDDGDGIAVVQCGRLSGWVIGVGHDLNR